MNESLTYTLVTQCSADALFICLKLQSAKKFKCSSSACYYLVARRETDILSQSIHNPSPPPFCCRCCCRCCCCIRTQTSFAYTRLLDYYLHYLFLFEGMSESSSDVNSFVKTVVETGKEHIGAIFGAAKFTVLKVNLAQAATIFATKTNDTVTLAPLQWMR
jgi:hypothetical protein